MMKLLTVTLLLLSQMFLTACSETADSPRGFSLPKGDAAAGEKIFVAMNCLGCHNVPGLERGHTPAERDTLVTLGGEVTRVVTYADLVTSIINPSHKLAKGYKPIDISENGKSAMRNYNDVLTVSDLINLVAFLQPKYPLKEIEHTEYGVYP